MNDTNKQAVLIVSEVTKLVAKSVNSVKKLKFQDARDHCIKGIALLALGQQGSDFEELFATCFNCLELASKDLKSLQKPKKSAPIHSASIVSPIDESKTSESTFSLRSVKMANVKFDGIIGCEAAKQTLHENIILPLCLSSDKKKSLFSGIRAGTGNVLLHGPPGTGKTLLAQATANEANAVLFSIRPSDVLSKYQGDSERFLRSVFEEARAAPEGRAIVFFDEFDSIALARGGGSDEGAQSRKLLSELLLQLTHNKQLQQQSEREQMDSDISTNESKAASPKCRQGAQKLTVDTSSSVLRTESGAKRRTVEGVCTQQHAPSTVVVIAATNRVEDLDPAVLRRFECKVYVGAPDCAARETMILRSLREIEHVLSADEIKGIVASIFNWSGCDIEALCREAAMAPIRELLPFSSGVASAAAGGQTEDKDYGTHGQHGQQNRYEQTGLDALTPRPVCLADFERAYESLVATVSLSCDFALDSSSI